MRPYLLLAALSLNVSIGAAQGPPEPVARALIPALKDARAHMQPRLTVEPGTLPPSPFTGRNSTLVAVTIGTRSVELDPEVVRAIDRLLAWDVRKPLSGTDREIVTDWIEQLRLDVLGRLAARNNGAGCDDACLIEHLTEPGPLFGPTRQQQVETRNEVLLNALIEVVRD